MKTLTYLFKRSPDVSKLTILTGHFGSGKTEIAINLALSESIEYEKIAINDLDVINPYFRSRDAESLFQLHGVELISPKGPLSSADLPIVSGEIYRVLHDPRYRIIVDAGGDLEGAIVLGQYYYDWKDLYPEMFFVLNACRPDVSTLAGAVAAVERIERASRLKVTGIINNTNLGEATTIFEISKGLELANLLAEKLQVPLNYTCISTHLRETAREFADSQPVKFIQRILKLPWEE
jgi:hypothetical protein